MFCSPSAIRLSLQIRRPIIFKNSFTRHLIATISTTFGGNKGQAITSRALLEVLIPISGPFTVPAEPTNRNFSLTGFVSWFVIITKVYSLFKLFETNRVKFCYPVFLTKSRFCKVSYPITTPFLIGGNIE